MERASAKPAPVATTTVSEVGLTFLVSLMASMAVA